MTPKYIRQLLRQLVQQDKKADKYASYSQKDKYGELFDLLLKYSKNYMEIRNLQEISPYIRLLRQETENNEQIISPVEASDNGVEWQSLDIEIQEAFQIYCLFDPVFILPESEFESDELYEDGRIYVEGYYNIQGFRLPKDVKKLFDENNDNIRKIAISFHSYSDRNGTKNYVLDNMVQKDFPPFSDTISLSFRSLGQTITNMPLLIPIAPSASEMKYTGRKTHLS
jgi:hypothetical protein